MKKLFLIVLLSSMALSGKIWCEDTTHQDEEEYSFVVKDDLSTPHNEAKFAAFLANGITRFFDRHETIKVGFVNLYLTHVKNKSEALSGLEGLSVWQQAKLYGTTMGCIAGDSAQAIANKVKDIVKEEKTSLFGSEDKELDSVGMAKLTLSVLGRVIIAPLPTSKEKLDKQKYVYTDFILPIMGIFGAKYAYNYFFKGGPDVPPSAGASETSEISKGGGPDDSFLILDAAETPAEISNEAKKVMVAVAVSESELEADVIAL
ncbi:hypothetical protein KAW80_04315 [Candidatus Babeliales bacterium]|nr:hypothetical protein [Candidatus Babeliales bacterium]